jgi:hypothetical protein
MRTYLKMKCMSLAAEAAIIRREEKKWPGESAVRTGLYLHRINDVRRECRSANLAYAFLRGRPYRQVEAKCHEAPNWPRVQKLAEKYGEGDQREIRQRLEEWCQAA